MRQFILMIVFVLLIGLANAKIELLMPVSETLTNGDVIMLGSLMPSETLEIIVNSASGFENTKWTKIDVLGTLEEGLTLSSTIVSAKSLVLSIEVAKDASLKNYSVDVILSNPEIGISESFTAQFKVKTDLLKAEISDLKQQTVVGREVNYNIIIHNDSIASHPVIVDSSLGIAWFKPRVYELKPRQTLNRTLSLKPVVHGKKEFKFRIVSKITGEVLEEFDGELNIRPTLKGKLAAANYGISFFGITLVPYFIFNSFLSELLKD